MKKFVFASLLFASFNIQAQSIQEGVKALDNEQFTAARRTFTELVKQNPNAENYFYLGKYFLLNEKLDSAETCFRKGIETNPKIGLNYVGLGTIEWAQKDTNTANKNFAEAVALRKREAGVYYEIADVLTSYEISNTNRAIEYLNKAITYSKTPNADYYAALGDAYLKKGDGTKAAENYNKAIEANSKSAKSYIQKGNLYIKVKNYNEALKLYQQGIAVDPNYAPGYRRIAELYFLAQQYDKGLVSYKKYMGLTDGDFETRFRYAKFLFKSKDYKEAEPYLAGLAKEAPNNYLVNRLLGYSYAENSNFKDALTSLNVFFANATPDKYLASDYLYLGKSQLKSGADTTQALTNLKKALELDSTLSDINAELAVYYFQKKQYQEAVLQYEAVLGNNKATTTDYLNLGKAYYELKNYTMADSSFNRMIKAKPAVANGYIWKCRTVVKIDPDFKTGAIKPSAEKYVEIVTKQTDFSKNKRELVEASRYLAINSVKYEKDNAKAKEYLNKALIFDPNDENAKKELIELK